MSEEQAFRDLIGRVRSGDQQAATDLVRRYENEIRRAIRVRLTDPGLCRVLDSTDVCQSVMANFFVRASAGQFELDRPDQLLRLLVTMARNKLLDQVRKQHADRRDAKRVVGDPTPLEAIADAGVGTPSQIVSADELRQAMQRQLSPEERFLAEQRAQGRDWADIAVEVGGTPEALRKKLARAMDRVSKHLGLEGS